jgi:CheY-like chemotaxis protein
MHRILAIEPDADRGTLLRDLLRDSLNSDLVVAASTAEAIAAMRDNRPDLILMSMLLPANEEQDLMAHLRATPSVRHLPVLTIPAVTDLSVGEPRSTGLFSRFLRRRQSPVWPAYNFNAVITRIEEALEQSAKAQAEAESVEPEIAAEPIIETPFPVVLNPMLVSNGAQRRARRRTMSEVAWVSTVKLSWGQYLRVVNISSSGVLVESGVRLSPGSATKFHIEGPDTALVVPARVVRCRVSDVDSLGVKYETAAAFDRPVDALTIECESRDIDSRLDELLDHVQQRAHRGAAAAELRSTFENGLLDLISAGEVRLRDVPVVENDGRESVYFTVPTRDGSAAVLQVTFNPNDAPGVEDFAVLTAATAAAAVVLPLTGTARQTTLQLPRPFVAQRTLELQTA